MANLPEPIKKIVKVDRKTFFDPASWIDLSYLVDSSRLIWTVLKSILFPEVPIKTETFAEAMQRFGLSDADVEQMKRRYLYYSFFMLFCSLIALCYAFYLLFKFKGILGFLVAASIVVLLAVQGFRFHFWYFQLEKKTLGLTFNDWKRYVLGE